MGKHEYHTREVKFYEIPELLVNWEDTRLNMDEYSTRAIYYKTRDLKLDIVIATNLLGTHICSSSLPGKFFGPTNFLDLESAVEYLKLNVKEAIKFYSKRPNKLKVWSFRLIREFLTLNWRISSRIHSRNSKLYLKFFHYVIERTNVDWQDVVERKRKHVK